MSVICVTDVVMQVTAIIKKYYYYDYYYVSKHKNLVNTHERRVLSCCLLLLCSHPNANCGLLSTEQYFQEGVEAGTTYRGLRTGMGPGAPNMLYMFLYFSLVSDVIW
jgi:hypothetical protein